MRRLAVFLAIFTAFSCAHAQKQETLFDLRARVFGLARVQAVYMDSLLMSFRAEPQAVSRNLCPRTFQGDTLVTSDIGWWTSGFYPGVLWQIYGETADLRFRELAVKHTLPLAGLLDRETDHDIGFQLMSSFGRWFIIDFFDPREEDVLPPLEIKGILEKGAEKLAARFIPSAGVIRSWNWGEWNIPVIIDNMMNLDLLMAYGDSTVAQKHALTTMENHFREDGTCVHLVDYADDGSVRGRQTVQGYADDTAWARGQAWALYGFATMAQRERISGNIELELTFRRVARKLEQWLLENLPEDGIPYWDFSQSDYKDASAGTIIACGLLKMHGLRGYPDDDPALAMAERILRTLASPEYLAEPRTNGGFLLKHSVGNLPGRSEIDAPLTYADYYFLEALTLFPN
ncbi:MAG: glycoside hydrolase family 88 protein [Bacteroidales bacterium]|nr:glycoside hydrolase family 88 protein [Bacteroidales bacterium]